MTQPCKDGSKALNTVLIVMVGQVGVVTLVVILLSVLGGQWLDNTFGTKPLFTAILLFAGVPISIIVMLKIARRTIARITKPETENKTNEL